LSCAQARDRWGLTRPCGCSCPLLPTAQDRLFRILSFLVGVCCRCTPWQKRNAKRRRKSILPTLRGERCCCTMLAAHARLASCLIHVSHDLSLPAIISRGWPAIGRCQEQGADVGSACRSARERACAAAGQGGACRHRQRSPLCRSTGAHAPGRGGSR